MSESTVAIIGSGIVGSTIAYLLTQKGIDVDIFEKGPEYPYPHDTQFREKFHYLYDNPKYDDLPPDIKNITVSGNYPRNPNNELLMRVGGSATKWRAITIRMHPEDFKTKSIYGYGTDWPISYNDLEPYYCKAESLLGVSGTDKDNPFSPRRSKPYPLPPFPLSYDDVIFADRLQKHGIVIHTTPQARTSKPYKKRPQCVNYGTCSVCPIGARYSPNYHLSEAVETKLCKVHTNTSVKRIVTDKNEQARSLIYIPDNTLTEKEHSAKVIIVAAGAIESARLLLLSRDEQHPDGIGNNSGHVGKHLIFHHLWRGFLHYKDYLFPGRFGGVTGQSHQFLSPEERGRHGGVKIEFPSHSGIYIKGLIERLKTGSEIVKAMEPLRHQRLITFHVESNPTPKKHVVLSKNHDRFGDPYAHIHYESSDFDHESYQFALKLFDRFAKATGAIKAVPLREDMFDSGAHHMGGIRMGNDIQNSVVTPFCKIHSVKNLYVVGGANFVSSSAVNPTLTIVALAIRAAEHIIDQIL